MGFLYRSMKINKTTISPFVGAFLFALPVALSFFSGIAHADTCTPPTPPVCYQNVPIYQNTGVQSNGDIVSPDGQWVTPSNGASNVYQNSEFAQVDCTGDPTYQGELLSYNECLQLNVMNQNSASLQEWLNNLRACHNIAHAYLDDSTNPNGQCVCQSPYNFDVQGQCVLASTSTPQQSPSANWCTNQHGIHAHILQYNGQDYCGCDDGYTTDANKQCVLMGPTYCADTYGINSHEEGAGCVCNNGYKGDANHQCVLSKTLDATSTSMTANQVAQSGTDTGLSAVSPAPTASSADSIIAQRRAALGMPPTGSLVAKIKQTLVQQGYTLPASASSSSLHSQIPSEVGATTTMATTTEGVASSTPAPAPKQKHWYEWLNPFNWFSWIH
jgi:hypothetical protein